MNNTSTKNKILVVDDSDFNRSIISDILDEEFEIIECKDGLDALSCLNTTPDISLVLLDIIMPIMDGMAFLEEMNKRKWIERFPVIIISADQNNEVLEKAYSLGAIDYIFRPFDSYIVYKRVTNTISLFSKQKQLTDALNNLEYEKRKLDFFLKNTHEIFFEYNDKTEMLSFSRGGAFVFNNGKAITATSHAVFSGNTLKPIAEKALREILKLTSCDYPDFKTEIFFNGKGYVLEGSTSWDYEIGIPKFESLYGRAYEI